MHIITLKRLREFWEVHPDAEEPLRIWGKTVSKREYHGPNDLRKDFASASFIGGARTVFNIGGNKYRLVVDMRYDMQRAYIRHILTHAEYDKLSARGEL